VQIAASVCAAGRGTSAADWRSAERSGKFSAVRRAKHNWWSMRRCRFERAHQAFIACAPRGLGTHVEALDFVAFEVGSLRAKREVENAGKRVSEFVRSFRPGRPRTSIRRLLLPAASTFVSSALRG